MLLLGLNPAKTGLPNGSLAVHYMIPLACGLAIPREFSKDWHIGKFFSHHQLIRRIA
jgi:hypothetical protein